MASSGHLVRALVRPARARLLGQPYVRNRKGPRLSPMRRAATAKALAPEVGAADWRRAAEQELAPRVAAQEAAREGKCPVLLLEAPVLQLLEGLGTHSSLPRPYG